MRSFTIQWIGPLQYRDAFYVVPAGVYMVFVGQHPIYVGAAADVARQLSAHIVIVGNRIHPTDMVGRELIDFARRYNQRLTVKVGRVQDATTGEDVKDLPTLDDVVALLVFKRLFPCNRHGRKAYEGSAPIEVRNGGKCFPLEPHYVSEETNP